MTQAVVPPFSNMDFGAALRALRQGNAVARAGWNGQGMWVGLQRGYPDGVPANMNTAVLMGIEVGTIVTISPYLVIKGVDGALTPWVPSQTDVLAFDWLIVG